MGAIDNMIRVATQRAQQNAGVADSVIRLQMLQQQREEERRAKEMEQVQGNYNILDKQLNDPNFRAGLNDDQVGQLLGARQALGEQLGLKVVDSDPVPIQISKMVMELQSNPKYKNVSPQTRYSMLMNDPVYGPQFSKIRGKMLNIDKLQQSAQTVDANGNPVQTQENKPDNADAKAMAAKDVEKMKQSVFAKDAEDMFKDFYEPTIPSTEAQSLLKTKVTDLGNLYSSDAPADVIAHAEQDVLNLAKTYNIPYSVSDLEGVKAGVVMSKTNNNFQTLLKDVAVAQGTMQFKANPKITEPQRTQLASMANTLGYAGKKDWTADDFSALGQPEREKTFYADKDRRLEKEEKERKDAFEQKKFAEDVRHNQKVEEQGDTRIANSENNGGSGGKGDKYGRDPSAIAAELSAVERKDAGQLGFSTAAILYGPQRVRVLMGGKNKPNSPYWTMQKVDKEGKPTDSEFTPGKTVYKLTQAGRDRIKEINTTEAQLHPQMGNLAGYKTVGQNSNAPIHYGTHKESGVVDVTIKEVRAKGKTLEQAARDIAATGKAVAIRHKGQSGITSDHLHVVDPKTAPKEYARIKNQKGVILPKKQVNVASGLKKDLEKKFGKG